MDVLFPLKALTRRHRQMSFKSESSFKVRNSFLSSTSSYLILCSDKSSPLNKAAAIAQPLVLQNAKPSVTISIIG